jgi:hypothetical protein
MAILWLALALAQAEGSTPSIRVTGRAVVAVQPERAEVDVGVVTEAKEAQAAARENAEKLDAVLKALRASLGPDVKIETLSYSLQPVYHRSEPRAEPVVSGYNATNVVRIRELPLDAVGRAIDVAASAGANSIRNIAFILKDEKAHKARALREAALDARTKADTLADALGLRVVRILTVMEGEADVIHPMPMARGEFAMAQAAPPTPIEAGTIEIRASVSLVVEIGN